MKLTRRTFTTLTTVAPMFAGATGKIRVAMIGTGHGHAGSKVKALQSMPEYDFAGVCRPDKDDPAVGDAFDRAPKLSLAQVVDDPSIELVALESADAERNLHYAAQCVAAEKFVHLDKPPGANWRNCKGSSTTPRNGSASCRWVYQWRYHPAMQAAMEAARKGWLGRVYRFRASIDKPILEEERRHLAKYRGGMMFSEGCHLIDRATALLGKPSKVSGFIRHHSPLDGQTCGQFARGAGLSECRG